MKWKKHTLVLSFRDGSFTKAAKSYNSHLFVDQEEALLLALLLLFFVFVRYKINTLPNQQYPTDS